MTLKTFNLDEEAYKEFSKHCKSNGISMSKKIENFIKKELEIVAKTSPNKNQKQMKNLNVEIPASEHSFSKYC